MVVPKVRPLSEERFHAAFLRDLSRLIGEHGESEVALWLGVSRRQLANIKAGSLPTADKIWNLLAHDPSAHDGIDAKYGVRKTPIETGEPTDALPNLTGVAHKLTVASSLRLPTHAALLEMEPEIDAALRSLSALKARCQRLRENAA